MVSVLELTSFRDDRHPVEAMEGLKDVQLLGPLKDGHPPTALVGNVGLSYQNNPSMPTLSKTHLGAY